MKPRRSSRKRGFVLLEIIMAMGLFGMIAVALTTALHTIAKLAIESRREVKILRKLETFLVEESKRAEFEELEGEPLPRDLRGESLYQGADEIGVIYTVDVTPLDEQFETLEGQFLERMWRVAVTASWEVAEPGGGSREVTEVAEVFRYEPLYQNAQ